MTGSSKEGKDPGKFKREIERPNAIVTGLQGRKDPEEMVEMVFFVRYLREGVQMSHSNGGGKKLIQQYLALCSGQNGYHTGVSGGSLLPS